MWMRFQAGMWRWLLRMSALESAVMPEWMGTSGVAKCEPDEAAKALTCTQVEVSVNNRKQLQVPLDKADRLFV